MALPEPTDFPRKKPRQTRSTETVRSIVEAAARILESKGFDGYNTNAVAEIAGVSPGSLYQYFPNKGSILRSVMARETSALLNECRGAQNAEKGIEHFVSAAVHHQMRRPELARLLDLEEARLLNDPGVRAVSDQAHAIVVSLLSHSNIPHQNDLNVTSRDVIAIVKGMVDAAGVSQEEDIEKLKERVLRAVYGYLIG